MSAIPLRQAMAKQEGWYERGAIANRPQRNNSPLDLEYCPEAVRFGAIDGDPRFAKFPDAATGWEAGRRWLSVPAQFENGILVHGYCGATLAQLIYRFAPQQENATAAYLANVCIWTDLTSDSIVTQALIDAFDEELEAASA